VAQGRQSPVFPAGNAQRSAVQVWPISVQNDSRHALQMSSDQNFRENAGCIASRSNDAADLTSAAQTKPDPRGAFFREKFVWLEQVRADPELTPLAFMLAYILADYVNEREGCAWPSIARLAAECRVTERGIQKTLRSLVERGHVNVELAKGRGKTNRYRWIVQDDRKFVVRREEETERNSSSIAERDDRKTRTSVHPNPPEGVNHSSEKGEQRFREGRTPVHPTLLKESSYDSLYSLPPGGRTPVLAAFDEFWQAYPKKIGRSDALRAFAIAVRLAMPEEIIRGAIRYAAERQGQDPWFTKNPATWLAKACWNGPSTSFRGPWRNRPLQPGRYEPPSIISQLHDDGEIEEAVIRLQQERDRRG
jgi:hypothetical protein